MHFADIQEARDILELLECYLLDQQLPARIVRVDDIGRRPMETSDKVMTENILGKSARHTSRHFFTMVGG